MVLVGPDGYSNCGRYAGACYPSLPSCDSTASSISFYSLAFFGPGSGGRVTQQQGRRVVMSIFEVKPSTLDGIKSLAKKIKRDRGIPHHEALDLSAQVAGFQNFRHAQQAVGHAPTFQTIYLSAYWYGSEGAGRETLTLQIEKPLSEISSRSILERGEHLRTFRLEFEDHLECREDLDSQRQAHDAIHAAARSIKFMDICSLRPETSAEQSELLGQFSSLPGKDHSSGWAHKSTGALVFMDEPYNKHVMARAAWTSAHDIYMLSSEWRGIYRPGHTIPHIFCSDQATMTLLLEQAPRLENGECEIHGEMESAAYSAHFVSPSRAAANKKRRPRAMPAIPDIEVKGALPWGQFVGGRTSNWRPAKRMSLDRHLKVGALLNSLVLSKIPYACESALSYLRNTLDNWMHLEFADDELPEEFWGAYYIVASPIPIRKGNEQLEAIKAMSDVLLEGYADCKPLHDVLKRFRQIHTIISRKL